MRLPPDISFGDRAERAGGHRLVGPRDLAQIVRRETCVPKRIGPAAMTMVRVATGFAFGATTLRLSSA